MNPFIDSHASSHLSSCKERIYFFRGRFAMASDNWNNSYGHTSMYVFWIYYTIYNLFVSKMIRNFHSGLGDIRKSFLIISPLWWEYAICRSWILHRTGVWVYFLVRFYKSIVEQTLGFSANLNATNSLSWVCVVVGCLLPVLLFYLHLCVALHGNGNYFLTLWILIEPALSKLLQVAFRHSNCGKCLDNTCIGFVICRHLSYMGFPQNVHYWAMFSKQG